MKLVNLSVISLILVLIIGCGSAKIEQEVILNPNLHTAPVVVPTRIISASRSAKDQVLVFTKTNGFRHSSIEKGVATLVKLGVANDFEITQTADSLQFNAANLKKYQLVIFLNTTMDVLGDMEQSAFENYIQNG